jgi:histidyl-tRNA synthetase
METPQMSTLQNLPGFRDFYPDTCAARERIFQAWRGASLACGFAQVDGPPLEPLELYQKKAGDELLGQVYQFVDKGERNVALRPEFTATLARMAGARQRDYKKPLKWFCIPQVFRYERTQKGRLREHFQWNCDILGEAGLGAETDLLAVLLLGLEKLGLTADDVVLRLSDRQFWTQFLDSKGIPAEKHYEVFQVIDKLDREPREKAQEKLGALAGEIFDIIGGRTDVLATPAGDRLRELKGLLDAIGLGAYVKIDLSIVRGLAYYTGIVFEVHDRVGVYRAVAGGGRYDNLVEKVAGVALSAVGFGMGDVVLGEMLTDKGLNKPDAARLDVYLALPKEESRPALLEAAGQLRRGGLKVDYPLAAVKLGKQFEAADDRGAAYAVVVEGPWAPGTKVQVKHLASRQHKEAEITSSGSGWTFSPELSSLFVSS